MVKKQYGNTTEASVTAMKMIAKFCVESGTVRRLIYTASIVSMSPMKGDGSGFKEFFDESCWTPLNLSYPFSDSFLQVYPKTKYCLSQFNCIFYMLSLSFVLYKTF